MEISHLRDRTCISSTRYFHLNTYFPSSKTDRSFRIPTIHIFVLLFFSLLKFSENLSKKKKRRYNRKIYIKFLLTFITRIIHPLIDPKVCSFCLWPSYEHRSDNRTRFCQRGDTRNKELTIPPERYYPHG